MDTKERERKGREILLEQISGNRLLAFCTLDTDRFEISTLAFYLYSIVDGNERDRPRSIVDCTDCNLTTRMNRLLDAVSDADMFIRRASRVQMMAGPEGGRRKEDWTSE